MNSREQEVKEVIKAFDKENSTLSLVEKINKLKGFVAGSIEYSAFSTYNEALWHSKIDELKKCLEVLMFGLQSTFYKILNYTLKTYKKV